MSKIYISSTYVDLKEHRKMLESALRRLGHIDIAMEHYSADVRDSVSKCLSDVSTCDLYIGIVAWRYGWTPPVGNPEGFSVTELEYLEALRAKRPCLIFLLDPAAQWPPDFIDDDRTRIRGLRERFSNQHLVAHFATPQELVTAAVQAIVNWDRNRTAAEVAAGTATLDTQRYYRALERRYRRLDLDALTPPQKEEYLQLELNSIFVEQNAAVKREVDAQEQEQQQEGLAGLDQEVEEGPVISWLSDPRNRRTVILGDPGSGKSTLVRYLLLSLTNPGLDPRITGALEGFVPFLIELRSYASLSARGKCESFVEFLDHVGRIEGWQFGRNALEEFFNRGGAAFVLFDGLDEIFDPEERERMARRIVTFAEDHPDSRVVVTSRMIGYRRQTLVEAGFRHAVLSNLTPEQVAAFATRWFALALYDRPEEAESRRDRLLRSFAESPSIRQLTGNPLLLTIMAIIGKHQELPRERWKIYDHAAGVLIHHWDVNKHLKSTGVEADSVDEEDKRRLLSRLAFRMQDGHAGLAGNQISREALQEECAAYVRERYQESPMRALVIARAIVDQLRERNFILSLYGPGVYGFVHRAFLEYFCALAYVHKFERTQELTLEGLRKDVFGAHWQDQSWHEVLRLICGMIGEKFAGEAVALLLEAKPEPHSPEAWNVSLAIRCLGEIKNLNLVAPTAAHALQRLFQLFDDVDIDGRFLHDHLVAPAIQIGRSWPALEVTRIWLDNRLPSGCSWATDQLFATLVAAVGGGSEPCRRSLLRYFERRPQFHQTGAVLALALGWRDHPGTVAWLKQTLVSAPDGELRVAALLALASAAPGEETTFGMIRERAIADRYWMVRAAAVYELGLRFSGHTQTFEVLYDRVLHDPASHVRNAARERLAEFFPGDRRTLALVLDKWKLEDICNLHDGRLPDLTEMIELATTHPDYMFRGLAIGVLAQHFPDIPESFPLIRERAVHDPNFWVRIRAVSALAKQFAEAPQVFRLLRERVFRDDHPWVRDAALELVVAHAPTDEPTGELLRHRALNDPDDGVRWSALGLLAKNFGSDWRTFPTLRERSRWDPDDQVRRAAVYLAAESFSGDPRVDALIAAAAYHDPSESVRESGELAAYSLDRMRRSGDFSKSGFDPNQLVLYEIETRSNEDLDELWGCVSELRSRIEAAAVNHTRASVRSAAMLMLRKKWKVSLDFALDRLAADADGSVRCEALRLLAENGDAYAAIFADRAANDPDGEVRAEAILQLAKVQKSEGFERFLADSSPAARRAAIYALAEVEGVEWHVKLLCQVAASDADGRVRLAATTLLSQSSSPAELEHLLECAEKDRDPVIVRAGREGIANVVNFMFTDRLLKCMRSSESAYLRLAAAARLCREKKYFVAEDLLWRELCEVSCTDPSPKVRKQLLRLLAAHQNYRNSTAELLERAISADKADDVREIARTLLEELW